MWGGEIAYRIASSRLARPIARCKNPGLGGLVKGGCRAGRSDSALTERQQSWRPGVVDG